MRFTHHRGVQAALALAVAASAAGGCSRLFKRGGSSASPPVPLMVRNRGFFDIGVYVVQQAAGPGTRIGTVTGNSSARLQVRASSLQPGGILGLRLHAIGTRSYWLSPTIPVGEGVVVQLDVYMNNDGDMSRSTLYTVPVAEAPEGPVPRSARAAGAP